MAFPHILFSNFADLLFSITMSEAVDFIQDVVIVNGILMAFMFIVFSLILLKMMSIMLQNERQKIILAIKNEIKNDGSHITIQDPT